MDTPDPDSIVAYIRENASTYTREAITENLLAQGFTQEQIDRVWIELMPEPYARPQRVGLPTLRDARDYILVIAAWFLVSILSTAFEDYLDFGFLWSRVFLTPMGCPLLGTLFIPLFLIRRGWKLWAVILGMAISTYAVWFVFMVSLYIGALFFAGG